MVIKSIKYITDVRQSDCDFSIKNGNKASINKAFVDNTVAFLLKIEFHSNIELIRNSEYKWVENTETTISNWYASKIIKLENGYIIQANTATGIWETNPKEKRILYWYFNSEYSKPITQYKGKSNSKHVIQSSDLNLEEPLELLITKENAIEFSRSEIPFISIACFTDHCDFDTEENLIIQRQFFKKHNIKITKGFFINDFSNRPNASFQNNADELLKWKNDGHELAYHSLSQSIKNYEDSFNDFEAFKPPFKEITTWIDHGYQPYNFSLFNKNNKSTTWFEKQLRDKNIAVLWNYIDSGTAARGVINQINPKQFTLKTYLKGIQNLSFKSKVAALTKLILFHFYNNEFYALAYKDVAKYYKLAFISKKWKYLFGFFNAMFKVFFVILKVFIRWNYSKEKPFPLAKYAPVIFKHKIGNSDFNVFQTLEMVDFKSALCKENIDLLVKERGLFIGHTYFSVPLSYHSGKLFKTPTQIDEKVDENFGYLSNKIKKNEVWNPTLKDLVLYLNKIERLVFDIDDANRIYLKSPKTIPVREIN